MNGDAAEPRILFSVVLADANVLYSRVLRDYILYATTHQLIRVRWSKKILDEAVRNLIDKVDGFEESAGNRLISAMNSTFPYAQVDLTTEAEAAVADFTLIDEAPDTMLKVHRTVVARLRGATDASTISALRLAGCERTADLIDELIQSP